MGFDPGPGSHRGLGHVLAVQRFQRLHRLRRALLRHRGLWVEGLVFRVGVLLDATTSLKNSVLQH